MLKLAAVLAVGSTVATAACGGDRPDDATRRHRTSGMSSATIRETVDTAPLAHAPVDTVNGAQQLQFTQAAVRVRLRAVGLVPLDMGTVRQPFLGPEGRIYRVEGGEVQAYIYGDAVALARDTYRLDTARVAPRRMQIEWKMPPSLIVTNNLAIILLTRDPELRSKVRSAFRSY